MASPLAWKTDDVIIGTMLRADANLCNYVVVAPAHGVVESIAYATAVLSRWMSSAVAGRGCSIPVVSSPSAAPLQVIVRVDGSLPVEAIRLRAIDSSSSTAVSYVVEGGKRGVIYAAYELLERVLGFGFLADNATHVPALTLMPQRAAGWRYASQPAFEFRSVGYADVLAYRSGSEYAIAGARDNSIDWKNEPKPGGGVYYANPPGGVHTAFRLLPPQKYGADHPEWFGGFVTG
eukprot:SAG31_NODE_14633_length_795_cov_1.307471_1_plen_233_part_10